MSRRWAQAELNLMQEKYPVTPTRDVAKQLGRTKSQVYQMAAKLGLRKSEEYLADPTSGRFLPGRRRSKGTEFRPGQTPWNKGKKMRESTRRKVARTMFKPGRAPHEARNYRPIGSLRVTKDGILEKKVTDDQNTVPARRWLPVARIVWEAENGPVPDGYVVRFKDGAQTTVESEITIDKLECVSRAENMHRNSVHRLPPELAKTVQMLGVLNRQINKRTTNEKQD